ncbi:MAG: hypothetical protein KFH98_13640 [Gemmatimonadetes bacterium]|nr:hypothetical protein [Gemmatimonadota bacterium]
MHFVLALVLVSAVAGNPSTRDAVRVIHGQAAADTAVDHGDAVPGDITGMQQERPLAVIVDAANGYGPVVRIGPVLEDGELERAAMSGLPLRVRVRVELWKDRFFDQLVDTTSWSTVIVHEPISDLFFVRSLPATRGSRRASSFVFARQAVESEYLLSMRPPGEGRYYYTVSLQIETLSVSDLDELERWMQGELQPAVSGQRSVPGAIGQGAKRLLLRILDLPERRYEARTGRFRVN